MKAKTPREQLKEITKDMSANELYILYYFLIKRFKLFQ